MIMLLLLASTISAQARMLTCENSAFGISIQVPFTRDLIANRGDQVIGGILRKAVAVKYIPSERSYLVSNCPDDSYDDHQVFHFSQGKLDGKFLIGLDLYSCGRGGAKEYENTGDAPLECH